jgi:HAD superfamily hydrolase (TIGR01459 family)
MARPPEIDVDELVRRYDAFLLDAYGVLVDSDRALPGAVAFIERLERESKPWLVVSNDASRLTVTSARRYRRLGFPIEPSRILTSGDLIAAHVRASGLVGGRALVLGPADSRELVRRAGMTVLETTDFDLDAVFVCDDDGYPFLPTIERTIDAIIACTDRGRVVELVLPNPDLIYPRGPGRVGITAGSVALLIENALRARMGSRSPTFTRLGKPHTPMFQEARRRLSASDDARLVMLGDQLATDVAGANAFGIDSVLLGTGVCDLGREVAEGPTWILQSLR